MPTLHEPRREIDEGERKYCIEKLKSEHQLPSDYPRGEGGDGRPPCLGPAPLMINGGYQAKGTPLPPPFALATRVIFLEWFSGKLEIIDDICVFDWTSPEWDSSIFFLLLFSPLSFFFYGKAWFDGRGAWMDFYLPLFVCVTVGAAENCVVRPKHCPLLIHWFYDGTRWVSLRHRWRMIIGIALPESTVWFPKQLAVTHTRKSSIATTHPHPKQQDRRKRSK